MKRINKIKIDTDKNMETYTKSFFSYKGIYEI